MTDKLRESVSALVDGEANELELQRLLTKDDARQVRQVWASYQLQRQLMREQRADSTARFLHLDISSRVAAALEAENSHSIESAFVAPSQPTVASRPAAWWRPFGGVAVAASVAAAVVIGVRTLQTPAPEFAEAPVVTVASMPSQPLSSRPVVNQRLYAANTGKPQVANVAATLEAPATLQSTDVNTAVKSTEQSTLDAASQERLQRYLLLHTERAALNSGQGMMAFARVATYEVQ